MSPRRRAVLFCILIVLTTPLSAQINITNVVVSENGGDGILIDSATPVTLTGVEVHHNLGAGIRALRADNGGLRILSGLGGPTLVHDNSGDGIVLGDPGIQTGKVFVFAELMQIYNNQVGIRVQQKNPTTQSTHTTLHGNIIHDNRASGIHFKSSYLQDRVIGETDYKIGFSSNKIFHNAMTGNCSSSQSAPQILVEGLVSVTPEEAAACATGDQATCEAAGMNGEPCYWTGSSCIEVWDLRGAVDCDDNIANPNQIHSYNTNTDPVGSSELSVGLYASAGAHVWADNNSWRTGDEAQNVDQDALSFVDGDTICPAGGILLQCSAP